MKKRQTWNEMKFLTVSIKNLLINRFYCYANHGVERKLYILTILKKYLIILLILLHQKTNIPNGQFSYIFILLFFILKQLHRYRNTKLILFLKQKLHAFNITINII